MRRLTPFGKRVTPMLVRLSLSIVFTTVPSAAAGWGTQEPEVRRA